MVWQLGQTAFNNPISTREAFKVIRCFGNEIRFQLLNVVRWQTMPRRTDFVASSVSIKRCFFPPHPKSDIMINCFWPVGRVTESCVQIKRRMIIILVWNCIIVRNVGAFQLICIDDELHQLPCTFTNTTERVSRIYEHEWECLMFWYCSTVVSAWASRNR